MEEVHLDVGRQKVPDWASKILKADELPGLLKSIAVAEAQTSGEIVPMIVRRSAAIGHVPFLIFFATTLIFALSGLTNYLHGKFELPLLANGITMLASLIIAAISGRYPTVQRWFTVAFDRDQQVESRAELEFYEAGLNRTKDSTGILIFVSLMEREVVVLADRGISTLLPQSTWDEIVGKLIASMKAGQFAKGLESAIHDCARILAVHFPRAKDDQNEIKDVVHFKE